MKLHRRPQPQFALAPFIPALSVAGLLGFFFLLGGTILLQPGISVQVPSSPFLLAPQRNPQVVAVTAAPVPGIYFDNRRVTLEELDGLLGKSRGDSRTIIIKADRESPVELVVEVSNLAIKRGFHVVLATAEKP